MYSLVSLFWTCLAFGLIDLWLFKRNMHQQADVWEALFWLLVSHLLWGWCNFFITKSKAEQDLAERSLVSTVCGLKNLQNLWSNHDKEQFNWWILPGLCDCIVIAFYVLSGSKMIPEHMVQNTWGNMNVLSLWPTKVDGQIAGIFAQSLPYFIENTHIIGDILSSMSLTSSLIAKQTYLCCVSHQSNQKETVWNKQNHSPSTNSV